MAPLTILFDGQSLSAAPAFGPAALHLLTLLDILDGLPVRRMVALPAESRQGLPAGVEGLLRPARSTLDWEQRVLPALARESGAQVLHLLDAHVPLAGAPPVIISPTSSGLRSSGFSERLRSALSAALPAAAVLWPDDLPIPASYPAADRLLRLPPLVHPAFAAARRSVDGEAYILYRGALNNPAGGLKWLLEGWKWAGPAVGQLCPLVLPSPLPAGVVIPEDESIQVRPVDTVADLADLTAGASVVVTLEARAAWGDPLLEGMAAGRPVVSVDDTPTGARVGAAGYLVPRGDARALGAALVTLAVETEMAEGLGAAAQELTRERMQIEEGTIGELWLEAVAAVLGR